MLSRGLRIPWMLSRGLHISWMYPVENMWYPVGALLQLYPVDAIPWVTYTVDVSRGQHVTHDCYPRDMFMSPTGYTHTIRSWHVHMSRGELVGISRGYLKWAHVPWMYPVENMWYPVGALLQLYPVDTIPWVTYTVDVSRGQHEDIPWVSNDVVSRGCMMWISCSCPVGNNNWGLLSTGYVHVTHGIHPHH